MRCHRLFLLGLIPILAIRAGAQRIWLPPDPGRNVGLEIAKGFFAAGTDIDFASFVLTAQGRFPVSQKLAVTVALPFARVSESGPSFDGVSVTQTSTEVGNPWLGIEAAVQHGLVIEAGVRPGIASDAFAHQPAAGLGVLEDYDRFEAWSPRVTTIRGIAHIGAIPDRGAFVSAILGGTVAIPSASNSDGDVQFVANYGLRAGYSGNGVLASLALTGRANLTEGDLSFDERTTHQVAFSVEGTTGRVRPSASIRSFLDDGARQVVKAIVTIGAAVAM